MVQELRLLDVSYTEDVLSQSVLERILLCNMDSGPEPYLQCGLQCLKPEKIGR